MAISWKKIWMSVLGLCLCANSAQAQFYLSGDDPSQLRWSQLQVGKFQLIYPQGLDSLAYHYADAFQEYMPYSLNGLNAQPRRAKIPVILHAYSADANAMVAWTPRRMEFFSIPSPEVSILPWSQSLVLHEGRHVAQMLRSGDGVFRRLHYVLGEQSEGLAAAYYDMWSPGFFEGDAVMAETQYSQGGRGRQANFLQAYRAYFADSIHFSYDKWQFGSYRHYIPNEYALGYLKWSAGQAMNKANLSQADKANALIFDEIARHPLRYRRAYERAYGLSLRQLWHESQAFYTQYWRSKDSAKVYDKVHQYQCLINEKDYASYALIKVLDDGRMLLFKKSMSETSRVQIYDPKTQSLQTLFLTGNVNTPIRASKTHLYWTELKPHPRWQHQSFSVLCAYDLSNLSNEKKRPQYLTQKSLFYHPTPSFDNRYLAVVEGDLSAKTRLLIFRTQDMQPIFDVAMPAYDELKEMLWVEDNSLYLSVLNQDGLRLDVLDLSQGKLSSCIAPQHRLFKNLSYHQGCIYFDADVDATTQIYEYQISTKELRRLTQARFSASHPQISGQTLYFIDFTRHGGVPASLELSELRPKAASFSSPENFLIDDLLSNTQQTETQQTETQSQQSLSQTTTQSYETWQPKPYHKLTHLFKFHSWAPLYYDKDQLSHFNPHYYYQSLAPGLSLFTQNDLGTAYGQVGYSFHDGYHALHTRFTYSGLWPVFSLSLDYNDATSHSSFVRNDTLFYHSPKPSLQGSLVAYVPLSFKRSASTLQVLPALQWYFDNEQWYSQLKRRYEYKQFILPQLQASWARDKALRDLKSPLYAGFQTKMLFPLSAELYYSMQSLVKLYAGTYVGLLQHDNLSYEFANQRYYMNSYTKMLMQPLLTTRGFDAIYAERMNYHAVNYTFPCHLDWSLPGVVYLKRLETTVFAEVLSARRSLTDSRDESQQHYGALGLEASFNLHPLRSNFNLNLGVRATLSQAPSGSGVEMIVNIPYL